MFLALAFVVGPGKPTLQRLCGDVFAVDTATGVAGRFGAQSLRRGLSGAFLGGGTGS